MVCRRTIGHQNRWQLVKSQCGQSIAYILYNLHLAHFAHERHARMRTRVHARKRSIGINHLLIRQKQTSFRLVRACWCVCRSSAIRNERHRRQPRRSLFHSMQLNCLRRNFNANVCSKKHFHAERERPDLVRANKNAFHLHQECQHARRAHSRRFPAFAIFELGCTLLHELASVCQWK